MTRLYGWLLALYALSVCFGDAFGPHPWVPIPLAVLLGSSLLVGGSLFLKPRVRFTGGCVPHPDRLGALGRARFCVRAPGVCGSELRAPGGDALRDVPRRRGALHPHLPRVRTRQGVHG